MENSKAKRNFDFEDFCSGDCEVYSFQCPETFDKQNLLQKTLNFNSPNLMTDFKNQIFSLEVLKVSKECILVAVPTESKSERLIRIPITGHILVQKTFENLNTDFSECINNTDPEIHFPTDLKTRHPLLGISWKEHMKVADKAIEKRLKLHRKGINHKGATVYSPGNVSKRKQIKFKDNTASKKAKK